MLIGNTDEAIRRSLTVGARAVQTLVEDVEAAQVDVQRVCHRLRPVPFTQGGLAAALTALSARTPFPVTLDLTNARMDPPIESAVYFLCAEALSNVTKHARATAVTLRVVNHADAVVVDVQDNGAGGATMSGRGLRGLADRVEALGGQLTVTSKAGGGTSVRAVFPTGSRVLRPVDERSDR
jgi:signal transduction histidine kinase